MEALIASYRVYDTTQPVDLYFELGDIGEDLDGDGILDAETSPSSSGFSFNDGPDLLVGGGPKLEGNQVIDTEGAGDFCQA